MGPLLEIVQSAVDGIADHWPAPSISKDQLDAAKIIAHRGAFGPGSHENLCDSLVQCRLDKIWGVEFDVRWNAQEIPILMHDPLPDRSRADKLSRVIAELSGRCHLMIEIKEPLNASREFQLIELLEGLKPVTDYHFLTLDPELFVTSQSLPKESWVLVTETKPAWASDFVLKNGWGGVAGHYLLMSNKVLARHRAAGQRVGVGFIGSPNNLCRQLARDVDWVFSNHAPLLQKWIKARIENE